ncbi:hypothetical protein LCGC14_2713230, partial [marine sediment metagenome]
GSAAGMIIPIAHAYIGDLSPEGQEGTWMGYFYAAFFTGPGLYILDLNTGVQQLFFEWDPSNAWPPVQ